MKIFFTLAICCLCLAGVYGQERLIPDGVYVLEKADLTIENAETKGIVEHQIITDATDIDILNMHLRFAFCEMKIQNGSLQECVMADGKKYRPDELMQLQPAQDKDEIAIGAEYIADEYLFMGREVPFYEFQVEGDKLTITFLKYNFGQSDVNYTMAAQLILTMAKQKNR